MRILVIGGAGFIGSHIVDQYLAAGHQVAVIDNLQEESGGRVEHVHKDAEFYCCDIARDEDMVQVFSDFEPELVNYHASRSYEPTVALNAGNVLGVLNVLSHTVRVRARKIIFASSEVLSNVIRQEIASIERSPYGLEQYVRYWQQAYDLPYTIFRYSSVYGPRQRRYGEAGRIVALALNFQAGEGVPRDRASKMHDYVYVQDVARANDLALQRGDNHIITIQSGAPVSEAELYSIIGSVQGVQFTANDSVPAQTPEYREPEIGWQPLTPLREGIRSLLVSLQQEPLDFAPF